MTTRLIDASTGHQFDLFPLEEASDAPTRLLTALADELTRRMRRRIGEPIARAEQQDAASNDDAWRLFHIARALRQDAAVLGYQDIIAGSITYGRADSLLAEAEKLDPDWLAPTLERGWIAASQSILALQAKPDSIDREARFHDWMDWGIAHSERVLERRPAYPKALELRGFLTLRYFRFGKHVSADTLRDAALRDLLSATTSDPNLVRAWITLSELYESMGSKSQADLAAERAAEADVYELAAEFEDELLAQLYRRALDREDYEEARERCQAGRHYHNPNFSDCELAILGDSGAGPEDITHAWRLLEQNTALPKERWPHRYLYVAAVIARSGLPDSALRVIERAREQAADDAVRENLMPIEAWVRTVAGDHDAAVTMLTEYLRRNPERFSEIAAHRWFRELQALSEFRAIVPER